MVIISDDLQITSPYFMKLEYFPVVSYDVAKQIVTLSPSIVASGKDLGPVVQKKFCLNLVFIFLDIKSIS
jgi:hypothetical protein